MKFAFVILLLSMSCAHGQQSIEESTNILLRLSFPSFYNSYFKTCCKLYPGGCYLLLNSNGYVCDFLRGRVTQNQGDGWLQFTISNAHLSDQGFYRCTVMGTPIYSDYYVEVKDIDPLLSHKPTTKAYGIPTDQEPTEAVLEQDMSDPLRDPWSVPLPAVVSVAAVICILSLTALVFCCVKAKQKQSNTKHAESPPTDTASVKQDHVEISAVIYTTVDFQAHQTPTYENLRVAKIQEGQQSPQHAGNVEYSTLAVHQHP